MIWKVIVPPSTRDESMVYDWAEQPGARDPGDVLRGYNILSLATPCQPGRIGPELPVARQFLFEQLPPSLSYMEVTRHGRARDTSKHPNIRPAHSTFWLLVLMPPPHLRYYLIFLCDVN